MTLSQSTNEMGRPGARHVLIVDDDQQFNALLSEIFRGVGYRVTTAGTAEDGLRVLAAEKIDLILTDQRMPGMSGVAFIESVRANYGAKPIIMISGFLESDTMARLKALGVTSVFSKPMNISDLLRVAGQMIAHPPEVPTAARMEAVKAVDPPQAEAALAPSFQFLPGHSEASRATEAAAAKFRDFSGVIALCGPKGTDFARLARRWLQTDPLRVRDVELHERALWSAIKAHAAKNGAGVVVLLERAVDLSGACLEVIHILSERGQREFTRPIRWICCYPCPIEQLYDKGRIEDDFYLFLNGRSVNVPPLKAIPEDWVDLARVYLFEADPAITLSVDAIDFLTTEAEFPGGMCELAQRLDQARERLGKRTMVESVDLRD